MHFLQHLLSYLLPIQLFKGGGASPPMENALLLTDLTFFQLTDNTNFLLAQ
jgi:hypothetical protein